jgi:hypothetical protein
MAIFVHLAPLAHARHIRRVGLAPRTFASPVVPDFARTHQWLRELLRWRKGPLVGIYFRLPGDEPVLVGRYGQRHDRLTADEAVARLVAAAAPGLEVIVPRRVRRAELLGVRSLPQVVGWRYFPEAKGRRPSTCPCCLRGQPFRRLVREERSLSRRP